MSKFTLILLFGMKKKLIHGKIQIIKTHLFLLF